MSNFDICDSPEDFWWSQKSQTTNVNNSHRVSVCNIVENEHTMIQSANDVEMSIKAEGTTEDVMNVHDILVKNNNSMGKRPSGAQRRKRKWRRLESCTASIELNNIESGLKILNIGDLGEDKVVVPSLSKINLPDETVNQRKYNVKNFITSKSTKHSEHFNKSENCVYKNKYVDNSVNRILECSENRNAAYSSVLKNKLLAVIIDESNIDGTLSTEQSDQIIDKLMTKLSQFSYASDSEVPRFQGYYLSKGVLTINCVNDKSIEWLMNVHLNDLWDGAKIKIMTANEFAKVIRMTAFIPGPIRENIEILKLLKTQNSDLKTSRWRIYHRSQGTSTGMTLVLGIDEKSLEVLRSLQMKPYYGISRAAFYLPDTKQGSSTRK